MSSYEILTDADVSPIEFIEQAPWVSGHGHIADVLGLPDTSLVYAHEGDAESLPVLSMPDQPHILVANGISKCMVLLFPAGVSGDTDTLAHTTKEQFGGTLLPYIQPGKDAIFIKHTPQTVMPAFEVSSIFNGMRRTFLRINAGRERMGVAWDVSTGIISVVRRDPDTSVLRFRLTGKLANSD
jgi:hypothetical protein